MRLLFINMILYSLIVSTSQLCYHGGKYHAKNEEWGVRKLRFKCIRWGGGWVVTMLRCVTKKGRVIAPGSTISEGKRIYTCKLDSLNSKTILVRNPRSADGQTTYCRDSQKHSHELGTYWIEKDLFNQTCTTSGITTVECIVPGGLHIPVGHSGIVGNKKYECHVCDTKVTELVVTDGCVDIMGVFHYYGEMWVEQRNILKICYPGNHIETPNCTCVLPLQGLGGGGDGVVIGGVGKPVGPGQAEGGADGGTPGSGSEMSGSGGGQGPSVGDETGTYGPDQGGATAVTAGKPGSSNEGPVIEKPVGQPGGTVVGTTIQSGGVTSVKPGRTTTEEDGVVIGGLPT